MGLTLVEIFNIKKNKVFSYEEAVQLLPLVYRITEEVSKEVKYLMACVDALPDKNSASAKDLQDRINQNIEKWQNKLERLGVRPKGLWLADFDYGQGYFCWKFPETEILFKHGYQDGFTGRTLINDNVKNMKSEIHNENSPSPN